MRIHFICIGNSFRSIIAEAYAKSLHLKDYEFSSSGLMGEASRLRNLVPHEYIEKRLENEGLKEYIKQNWGENTHQVTINNADLCVYMNKIVEKEGLYQKLKFKKTITLDIDDVDEGSNLTKPDTTYEFIVDETYPKITKSVDKLISSI